jgi:ribose/xylose/arabinose/galactoside ABC-type transport system permease subunit
MIFFQWGNLTDVLRQVSVIGVIAVGMTFVILTAGIDLSVGSIVALTGCVATLLLTQWQPDIGHAPHAFLAATVAVGVGMVVGAFNGWLVAGLRISPFIATLAAMIGFRGLAKWLTDNATIDVGFGTNAAATFARVVSNKSMVIGAFVLVALLFGALLRYTVFGRYVRAVGDNATAARYSGLPIRSVRCSVYVISGLLAGIGGLLYAAQTNQGDPNAAAGYELDVIAAVVLGGTALTGGRGSIAGTVIGTLIIGTLTNLLGLNNIDSNVQMMLKAAIIVGAVWVQRREAVA